MDREFEDLMLIVYQETSKSRVSPFEVFRLLYSGFDLVLDIGLKEVYLDIEGNLSSELKSIL